LIKNKFLYDRDLTKDPILLISPEKTVENLVKNLEKSKIHLYYKEISAFDVKDA
jgi:hypothetical protein